VSRFREWGFDKGWGNTAGRVKETMRMLSEVLEAGDPIKLESLFSRLPNMFNIVIFSIHGYFGQADVLGLPDTGGQVLILPYWFLNTILIYLTTFLNRDILWYMWSTADQYLKAVQNSNNDVRRFTKVEAHILLVVTSDKVT
jgi:hypothetical protein